MTRADKQLIEMRGRMTEGRDMLIECDRKFAAEERRTDRQGMARQKVSKRRLKQTDAGCDI